MASTLGADNPLRYRGYVYDSETWFYYLQSRYYSFEWGKFISADAFVSTGQGFVGNNMFAYCLNNPVCRKDIPGTTSVEIFGDGDSNILDDDKTFSGTNMSNDSFGGSGIKSTKLSFKSESALDEHYEKHNSEFGNAFSTPQEYVDAANYVIESGEYIGSQNAYVKFYGKNGFANYAFVGLSHDHSYITTFHIKDVSQIKF